MPSVPAPGCRYAGSGLLGDVGNNGYCWASTTKSINGMNLSFCMHWFFPNGANGRALGFPLRCLSE